MSSTLIVIPTYNEKENIQQLIEAIEQTLKDNPVDILVVDDNSPDGTGALVQELMKSRPHLHHLHREEKQGLGRAYIAGFKWALERDYEVISEMDADFSHRPVDLARLLEAIKTKDFVVGSRYVDGGETVNWGLGRKLISRGGSLYARFILGYPINDWTGGFNVWRRKVLESIGLDEIRSDGYSFQIELKYRSSRLGFEGQEVPITFEDRRIGQSKMSTKIVIEGFYKVWVMRFA